MARSKAYSGRARSPTRRRSSRRSRRRLLDRSAPGGKGATARDEASGREKTLFEVERKPNFQLDLEVVHLSVLDVSARFDHLEPANIPKRFAGALNRRFDGVFNGRGRRADKFDDLINMI